MPPRKRSAESPPEQNATLEDAVVDLTTEVRTLAQHVEVLRIAIDDLRQEVEWAIRNIARPAWTPTPPLTSMPKKPCAVDCEVNPHAAANNPAELQPTPLPADGDRQGGLFD